jgi:formylglycine-generating enzyme required for sulfatase activity
VAEVTVERYERFLEAAGRRRESAIRGPEFRLPGQPITLVSWDDASAFCTWATLALPPVEAFDAAAVWDGAARRAYPWGDVFEDGKLPADWLSAPPPVNEPTADVSPWGVRSLASSCHEWTATVPDGQPGSRVVRGGSCVNPRAAWGTPPRPRPEDLSASWTTLAVPMYRAVDLSFRTMIALEPAPAEAQPRAEGGGS